MNVKIIIALIDHFTENGDISIESANRIETALHDAFPADEYVQDIVDMLASYRPGGGDFLYDTDHASAKLRTLKIRLNQYPE